MSLPTKRTRALIETRHFLEKLSFGQTDDVPLVLRGQSQGLLQHFPTDSDLQLVHQAIPAILGPVPWLQRAANALMMPVVDVPPAAKTDIDKTCDGQPRTSLSKTQTVKSRDAPPTVPSAIAEIVTVQDEFPVLESITRSHLTTKEAAFFLNRRPQTLRVWACYEDGPLRPLRVNGHLAWSVSELRRVLGSSVPSKRKAGD